MCRVENQYEGETRSSEELDPTCVEAERCLPFASNKPIRCDAALPDI